MKHLFSLLGFVVVLNIQAQTTSSDTAMTVAFFNEALSSRIAYEQLEYLCIHTAGRICGSPQAAAAVEYTYQLMLDMPFDTVYKQPTMVTTWRRGEKEKCRVLSDTYGQFDAHVCALGGSVGTGYEGILANVVTVDNIEQLKAMKPSQIKGKIVYFNKPFTPIHFNTYRSYGEGAQARVNGAWEAGEMGAVAVVIRSLTHSIDTFPHTGITRYRNPDIKIPAFAISTADAEILDRWLKNDPELKLYLESHCSQSEDVQSFNVIGEIRGSEFPERIITVGGHLDSWDLGHGAHDDGVGCIHSIEVARLFFALDIKPRNTIRIVMFMDEEMNQRGGQTYASTTITDGEQHYFALESDRGGFTPHGFSLDGDSAFYAAVESWFGILELYGIWQLPKGFSGVDITPLKKQYGTPLAAIVPDTQRYFDYQHSGADTFDKVNHREMQLGSAAMAVFVYFIDKYGY
jgi:carboxypeptidase Q